VATVTVTVRTAERKSWKMCGICKIKKKYWIIQQNENQTTFM